MKRGLFLRIFMVAAILLFTVSSVSALTIGHVTGSLAAFSQERVANAMKKICEMKGWKLHVADAKGDWAQCSNQIENFIAKKVDVITLAMVDLRSIRSAIETANKAGIPIYGIDSGSAPGIMVDVTSNNYVIGSLMASYMADRLQYKGKIVSLGLNEHHGVRKRTLCLGPVLKENKDIELLSHFDVRYCCFYEDARRAMEDYLTKYGKQINAVFCGWDDLADAASKAIMDRGFTRKDIFVVGADGHPHAYAQIRNPKSPMVATVAQKFSYFASITLDLIDKIQVQGVKPESVIPETKRIYVDSPLVDSTNVPAKGKLPWPYPWK